MNKKQLTLIILILLASLMGLQAATVIPIGDVNRSGTRDIVDALLVAQYSAKLIAQYSFFMNVADVNLDNTVNIVDAVLIAQASVGLITSLAAEEPYAQYQSQLNAAKKQWNMQLLINYTMNLKRSCFCPDANNIYKLDVALSEKTSVINTTDNSTVDPNRWREFPTIEELFVIAQDAINQKYVISSLTFDRTYSFISNISMNPDVQMADGAMAYTVTDYQPKDAIPPITWTTQSVDEISLGMGTSRITYAAVHGNMLTLEVEYGGGCFEHNFKVFADSEVLYSYPPQIILYVQNDDLEGDYCMAIVDRSINIDLTPLGQGTGGYTLLIPTDGYHMDRGYLTIKVE